MNMTPTELAALVGAIDPQSAAAGTYNSGYIPLKNFRRYQAIVQAGAMTATGTLNAKLVAYTDGAGAGATDIPGATITQLTAAGTDSNKQALINFNTDLLAGTPLFTHMRLVVTTAVAASLASAVVLGFDPRVLPASDNDATSVDEIVTA